MEWPCSEVWDGRPPRVLVYLEKGNQFFCWSMYWQQFELVYLFRVAATVEVKVRPKGLGLGADHTVLQNAAKGLAKPKEGDEELKVVVGANVQLLSGKHQGLYGQVSIILVKYNTNSIR